MKDELPQLCNYASTSLMYSPVDWSTTAQCNPIGGVTSDYAQFQTGLAASQFVGGITNATDVQLKLKQRDELETFQQSLAKKEIKKMASARILKVIIVDPDTNLTLDKRVIYKGDEIFTDLTDQELFYEVNIKDLLVLHNNIRTSTKDKKASAKQDKDVFLEPVRVRDLKMVVSVTAEF